jgi:hypothetical protein
VTDSAAGSSVAIEASKSAIEGASRDALHHQACASRALYLGPMREEENRSSLPCGNRRGRVHREGLTDEYRPPELREGLRC